MLPTQLIGLLMLLLAILGLVATTVSMMGWKAGISIVAAAIGIASWVGVGAFLLTGGK